MKKIIYLISVIIIISIFLILKNNVNNDSVDYTYSYYRGYYFNFNIVSKINNQQSIEDILSKINNLSDEMIHKLKNYEEEYFKEKELIIIYFPMGSGTPTSSLESLKIKDNIEILINIKKTEFGTDDMSGHLYVIELEKSDKNLIVYTKTNQEELQILESSCEFSKTYKVKNVVNIEPKCQTITLNSFTSEDEYELFLCNTDYIKFEKDKMYKFTFAPIGTPSIEDSIKNMMLGNFIDVKIEETNEIINENICNVENRYFMETNDNYTCFGDKIKSYSKTENYNIYTYCMDDIYVIDKNDRISLKAHLNTNDSFIDEIISKMILEEVYDERTTVYKGSSKLFNNGLTLIKCSNNNIYITDFPVNLKKEQLNFCK